MNTLNIYTDGGFRSKYKVGSYAYVVINNETIVREFKKPVVSSNLEDKVTNITMEMKAVIEALKYINSNFSTNDAIYILTDSQYVQLGVTDWSNKWRINGWKNAKGKTIENYDLWRELLDLYYVKNKNFKINIQWVRGHDGNRWNEYVDKMCNDAMDYHIINHNE